MTIKWSSADLDHIVERYRSGQSLQALADGYGVSRKAIARLVKGLPDYRAAAASWEPPDLDSLIERYRRGESVQSLAKHYGVHRGSITRILRELPDHRGRDEANRLMAANRTPEQRRAWTAAAQDARRGQRESFELKCRRAQARQNRLVPTSATELRLAAYLAMRGLDVTLQQAIGPYNCDIAVDSIAVECYGGHWHASGRHRARFPDRARYILDQGWLLVLVWITDYEPLRPALADYLVALVKQARSDPSLRGQYRVVWGGGHDCTRPGLELDQLARVPPYDGSTRTRT